MNIDDHSYANAARCVRGDPPAEDPGRFQIMGTTGQQTVLDRSTGLLWQKQFEINITWQEALGYCEGLDYAGHDDWRLPNVNELRSLVDITVVDPATQFPDMLLHRFWSSTPSGSAGHAWYVNLSTGYVEYAIKTRPNAALCVRGGL